MSVYVEVDDSNCVVIVSPRDQSDDIRVTVPNVASLMEGLRLAKADQARREGMAVVGVSAASDPPADPAAFLRDRAASFSSDAGKFAHGRGGNDRIYATMYRTIADELRKAADVLGGRR